LPAGQVAAAKAGHQGHRGDGGKQQQRGDEGVGDAVGGDLGAPAGQAQHPADPQEQPDQPDGNGQRPADDEGELGQDDGRAADRQGQQVAGGGVGEYAAENQVAMKEKTSRPPTATTWARKSSSPVQSAVSPLSCAFWLTRPNCWARQGHGT
jgi:hypothetical protein